MSISRELCRFFRLGFIFQRVLGLIDNRFERGFVGDCEVGENFTIESNTGGFQAFHEAAVGYPASAGGGVEALDPEIAECAFAGFAIAIRPILAFHGCVFGVAEKFGAASAVAFGFFEHALAAGAAGRCIACSWHFVLPRNSGTPLSTSCCSIVDLSDLARRFKSGGCRTRWKDLGGAEKLDAQMKMTTDFQKAAR
jgi:hypothetical protein